MHAQSAFNTAAAASGATDLESGAVHNVMIGGEPVPTGGSLLHTQQSSIGTGEYCVFLWCVGCCMMCQFCWETVVYDWIKSHSSFILCMLWYNLVLCYLTIANLIVFYSIQVPIVTPATPTPIIKPAASTPPAPYWIGAAASLICHHLAHTTPLVTTHMVKVAAPHHIHNTVVVWIKITLVVIKLPLHIISVLHTLQFSLVRWMTKPKTGMSTALTVPIRAAGTNTVWGLWCGVV